MRKVILSVLGAAMVVGLLAPFITVHAATLEEQQAVVERLNGSFVLAVEDAGRLWYVLPTNGFRVYFANKESMFAFAQDHVIVIGKSELALLPVQKQKSLTSASKKAIAARKGSFVTTSAALTNMWYINPSDGLRYDVGTVAALNTVATKVAIGVGDADLSLVPVDPSSATIIDEPIATPVVTPTPTPIAKAPVIKSKKAVYKNGQIGWDFASGLWTGYQQYQRAFGDAPDIKWFDNVVHYRLPIYLNENGFSLDSGKQNFFVWNDFSAQWRDFYKNNFSVKREFGTMIMTFTLPSDVSTTQYGTLKAGTYYFTTSEGLISEKQYKIGKGTYDMTDAERAADTKRVFEQALAIADALNNYNNAVYAYPITQEAPIELGVNGLTALCLNGGFGCDASKTNSTVFLSNIQSGRPSTKIIYDSRYGGKSYTLTFTVYGKYEQYDPGVYEISPYTVKKIADITDNLIKR